MDAVVDKLIQTAKAIATPRLKDLIKSIRSCKTAAEERAVIAKESASIRTAFKEENMDTRHINVAKLLYIHMLGYPAHFGQMECLKLVASPKFSDKRLGYLGIMLLLDENQEVLTLVTNCLKNDMANPNMFIMGLALCTLGNISSPEMSRDLCSEVEKLMSSSNAYARKKANLCALRIIRKVPDLMENFFPKARNFVNERNHGVLLTGITLLTEMCAINKEVIPEVRKLVPALVGHLSNLSKPGFSPEHDVSGVTDPFLQVKILRLLRILGRNDVEASELMNDALATVANNTEASKNVGNAILYETVLTIMDIESEKSLRVLAINILGRFLSNRDNNIRYVALTTLTKTSSRPETADSSALQRHRSTILECLRDPDVSIRRRALDLSFYLIDSANIRLLTRELLSFLEVAEGEVKASVASRICDYAGRFRPNKRWEIDTVCRVLRVAGAFVDQLVINHFVKLVSTSPVELQQYTVRKLYNIVKSEGDAALMQEGLVQAMVWCCGEYGDTLTTGTSRILGADDEAGDDANADPHLSDYQTAPSESEVYETFASILKGPYATDDVQEYALTALAKLSTRFQQTAVISQIRTLIARYKVNIDVEIQQRAVEYTSLFGLDREISVAILEGVPVLESALREEDLKGKGTIGTIPVCISDAADAPANVGVSLSSALEMPNCSLTICDASPRADVPFLPSDLRPFCGVSAVCRWSLSCQLICSSCHDQPNHGIWRSCSGFVGSCTQDERWRRCK
ncbi:adaptin N terminal region-domain-containing protein [Polychytrium aggregatum]|uniref:adaptin N terminal region-domain-containing protein n=1 Tax=Polychytrium aggregatum TaxID=110093 RepID=UPI0022FDB97D|nr:adaptin N terminal region-domain-containing protein [Polychytrium aggregatum]KAI9197178.1 adaptin N terminal region-domain-containing protein [Polychytrium aggregatum]